MQRQSVSHIGLSQESGALDGLAVCRGARAIGLVLAEKFPAK